MSAPSVRSTVKRNARRAEYDRGTLLDILRAQQLCYVAYVEEGEPRQIATLYFVDDEYLYLHGNRQAAYLRAIAAGQEVCITVTIVDGVVVARSGFNCSMNYRAVTVFGCGEVLADAAHLAALDGFVRALVPGHEQVVRNPTSQEIAATTTVRIPLTEMSGKVRAGDPGDAEEDLASSVWAGVIPVQANAATAVPSADLAAGIATPDYIQNFKYRG